MIWSTVSLVKRMKLCQAILSYLADYGGRLRIPRLIIPAKGYTRSLCRRLRVSVSLLLLTNQVLEHANAKLFEGFQI